MTSGPMPSPWTARTMARWVALKMFSRSISRGSATPTLNAAAFSRTRAESSSRCFAVRRLESSTPVLSKPSPSTTTHATTGPHSAPRPTSSMPATIA